MTIGKECPAIAELKAALSALLPSVTLETLADEKFDAKWGRVQASRHTCGLAMDIMLDIREPREKAIADAIIATVTTETVYDQMGWSDLVYSDWIGDIGRGDIEYYHIRGKEYHGYGGTPLARSNYTDDKEHTNHIHIDWVDFALKNPEPQFQHDPYNWSNSAKRTGFAGPLTEELKKNLPSFSKSAGSGTPDWLWGWWTVTFDDGYVEYYYFGLAGFVDWTDVKPKSNAQPVTAPINQGALTVNGAEVVGKWNEVNGPPTTETFTKTPNRIREMTGKSSRGYGMTAKKN